MDKARAMVLASFAADSLSLGAHWIYDTMTIDVKLGRVDRLIEPLENSYHENKDRGAFTHYGDQTLCLLESVAAASGFKLESFADQWRNLFTDYSGYLDQATNATLRNFESGEKPTGSGSVSSDLGGASRICPIVYRYHQDPDKLMAYARAQTAMTHNNQPVIDSAGFFAALTARVMAGSSPSKAIHDLLEGGEVSEPLVEWISEGRNSAGLETRQVIMNFGQMCDIAAAFPSVIHLILKYETNLKEALVENVMAGGDSAARGLVAGMILGAHLGTDAIPGEWLSDLKAYPKITELMDSLDT